MVVSNIGLAPSISAIYSPNSSEDSGFMEVELKQRTQQADRVLRRAAQAEIAAGTSRARTLFASGSIIDSVLNFGLQAPIDVQLRGPDSEPLYQAAFQAQRLISRLPQVSQTFIPQESEYPTLNINVDRIKAARLGVTQKQVVSSVITALNSNMYIAPSIWIDHENKQRLFSDRRVS